MDTKSEFHKLLITPTIITVIMLLIPLAATHLTDEMKWSVIDFMIMGFLIFGTGFTYKLVTWRRDNLIYKVASGLTLITCFLLIWVNLAVGILGSEDNPANLLYGVVLIVGFLGAIIARFKAEGMASTLFIMTLVQILIPVIAYFLWKPEMDDWHVRGIVGLLGVHLFFMVPFASAGLLFKYAAKEKLKNNGSAIE